MVDVLPRLPLAKGAEGMLRVVLEVEMLSELALPLVGQETLHAHRLLRVLDAVVVEGLLGLAVCQADLADVVRLSDVVLELEKGLEVLPIAKLAGKLGPTTRGLRPVADV